MAKILLSTFSFVDMVVEYCLDEESGRVEMSLLPAGFEGRVAADKRAANRSIALDSLVQVKCAGDNCPVGFALGLSLRNSSSTLSLKYDKQTVVKEGDKTTIITRLISEDGFACEHFLTHRGQQRALEVGTVFINTSEKDISLEMLSSFSLGRLNGLHEGSSPEVMKMHRFRSYWSAEGRHESMFIEDLHLETSWGRHCVTNERFGQVGSMPVRKFFPFVAIEDTVNEVFWAAQLAYAGSWQLEVYKRSECLELSGGLADREFGHWMKKIAPGESFESPKATLTVCTGELERACDRLVKFQEQNHTFKPQEEDMPILFNEYCTTWGKPSHEQIITIAEKLKDSEVKYLVIDAGWYAEIGKCWSRSHGDWVPNSERFPYGLKATAEEIRKRGLIPGLWFEMETVGDISNIAKDNEHLLTRDGHVITVGVRQFWDLRKREVVEYLSERVIGLLESCGFGYLKVDYNETIGIGVDNPQSLGEGLREHTEAVQAFWRLIAKRLPELVIENCSSGGHRLEPSMLALADMGSFSDAHETLEIPIIAANLHALIPPRQNQIWAVLKATDTIERTYYSMAATFLGRMCVSGDICGLSDEQYQACLEGQRLYKAVSHIIRDGYTKRYGEISKSYREPKGWQAVVRALASGDEAVVVAHSFGEPVPKEVQIELPKGGNWVIKDVYSCDKDVAKVEHSKREGAAENAAALSLKFKGEFRGAVIYLQRS